MNTDISQQKPLQPQSRSGRFKILLLIVAVAIVTSLITVWLTISFLFPGQFKPVALSEREEQVLNTKLSRLDPAEGYAEDRPGRHRNDRRVVPDKSGTSITPERYSEAGAGRQIRLSERELNGLLARNTDLAHRLAIDLSKDLASAKLLIPLDPDVPFFGGKTLKVTAGLELRYDNRRPIVMLKGVSIWGIPLPNAWLGGLKNVDLVKEFGSERGFWKAFASGVEHVRVEEGGLSLKLKE